MLPGNTPALFQKGGPIIIPGGIQFTTTQWWTVPVGFNPNNNTGEAYGAGGGGAAGYFANNQGGGGGGGGGYSRAINMPIKAGDAVLITVAVATGPGAVQPNMTPGGTGGYSGVLNNAQTLWFCLAFGGGGGMPGSVGSTGGVCDNSGGVGAVRFNGGPGGVGSTNWGGWGGGCAGPNGPAGDMNGTGGWAGNGGYPGSVTNNALNGDAYGGGGGGAGQYAQSNAGWGQQGIVQIMWYA